MRSLIGIAAAGGNNLAFFQKGIRDRNRLGQKPARIVPQIENDAFQRVTFFPEEIINRIHQAGCCLLGKGGDPDIADAVENLRPHGPDLDEIPNQRDIERLLLAALHLDRHF